MLPASPTSAFPYKLVAKIGEGAMGEVYRAEDVELGRQVAIKVIKTDFVRSLPARDAQEAMQRFLQEARAAAALSHPGVTIVYRVGTENGWPYMAMEWLEGTTLESYLAQHRLTPDQAARVGLQVLSALDTAHRSGIVHRDIKPANLFITNDRRIKIMDFGVARVQGSNLAHTQAGFILGSPAYAAPEQLAGQPVDARADLYSLGAVLFESVTGRPPFDAGTIYELISLVHTGRVPSANLGVEFDEFITRALAKRPDDRFANAGEMARGLQKFLTAKVESPRRSAPGAEATLARVQTKISKGKTAASFVADVVKSWPAKPLGNQNVVSLVDKLLDTPPHVAAFCGGLEVEGTLLLICDGVLFDVLDPVRGLTGDMAMDQVREQGGATLYPCPPDTEPRIVALLASLLAPKIPRLSGLNAAYVDVPQLAARLSGEGFDGSLRLTKGEQVAFILFSKGKRVLDIFGHGWQHVSTGNRWETWIADTAADVTVDDKQHVFPAATFRRQLRDVVLRVHRPTSSDTSIRTDARSEAESIVLKPEGVSESAATESTLQSLITVDPSVAVVRWLLVDVQHQFEQYKRTERWKGMITPLASVAKVRLHPSIAVDSGTTVHFDALTYDQSEQPQHAVMGAPSGTKERVNSFIANVLAAHAAGVHVKGAILVAPSFTEDALDAYMKALRASQGSFLRAAFDRLSHREGFLSTKSGGCHVLLVEEAEGRRRPLMPQES